MKHPTGSERKVCDLFFPELLFIKGTEESLGLLGSI
jgi:hypothetical protein